MSAELSQKIQRAKGDTQSHLYDYSHGYPIRVCTWTYPETDIIENGGALGCKKCQAYRAGKFRIFGAPQVELAK